MSMPSFPEESLDITCDQALNMLLGSIAMEELALSHIMNAEGEKLQYVLGTLPGGRCTCAQPKEILEVNRSVSELLEKVAYNQILLKGKLQQVIDARGLCRPAPEPPHPVCGCVLAAQENRLWTQGCPLPWKPVGKACEGLCRQDCSGGLISLCTQNTYLVCFSFWIRACDEGPVRVALLGGQHCECRELFVSEACVPDLNETVHLSGSTVLSPEGCGASISPVQFILKSPGCVVMEHAVLNLTVL